MNTTVMTWLLQQIVFGLHLHVFLFLGDVLVLSSRVLDEFMSQAALQS